MTIRRIVSALGLTAPTLIIGMLVSASAATPDIVLYASDVAVVRGNWAKTSATGAAGGQLVSSADNGWSTVDAPLAAPANFFEASFTATANTPYHVWLRLRASGNSKYNDSVWVQFSDAQAAGGPIDPIGSTSALLVNLASDAAATSLDDWGWQQGAYWMTQPVTVTFPSTGTHVLRIQTREDGVSFDQIVLSSARYRTAPPGPLSNDSTIVPKP